MPGCGGRGRASPLYHWESPLTSGVGGLEQMRLLGAEVLRANSPRQLTKQLVSVSHFSQLLGTAGANCGDIVYSNVSWLLT